MKTQTGSLQSRRNQDSQTLTAIHTVYHNLVCYDPNVHEITVHVTYYELQYSLSTQGYCSQYMIVIVVLTPTSHMHHDCLQELITNKSLQL